MNLEHLQSHGPGSSLLRHTEEVSRCALSPLEKGAAALHDALKASVAFQDYSNKGFRSPSPHRHAAAAAWMTWRWLLAHPEMRGGNSDQEAFAAACLAFAQAVCGHHSQLALIEVTTGEENAIRTDKDRLLRFANTILDRLSLHADFSAEMLPPPGRRITPDMFEPHSWLQKEPDKAAGLVLDARAFLGRLVLWDHASARAQTFRAEFRDPDFSRSPFSLRSKPDWKSKKGGPTPLDRLRSILLDEGKRMAARTLDTRARLLVLSSPTGTGKTNAMLEMAEEICAAGAANRIVYALPLLAIADQVYADYLRDRASSAQIYNHLRQETSPKDEPQETRADNLDRSEVALAEQPFGSAYNVTSFHQVLKALLHPNRHSCAYLEQLRDSVLIFDEFHRFPPSVLPPVIQLLNRAAERFNCHVILGSATPFPADALPWEGERIVMDADVENRLLSAPEVTGRRQYCRHRKARMTAPELAGELLDRHVAVEQDRSLLVLVNPLKEGTLAVARELGHRPTFTEREFPLGDGRILYLDAAIPPWRRWGLIEEIKSRLQGGESLTVVSTPILEIGVDIDFAEVWEDFVSIATTLQRGGRCNREGRLAEAWCRSFELMIPGKDDGLVASREHFYQINQKHDSRKGEPAFKLLQDAERRYFHAQARYLHNDLPETDGQPEQALLDVNKQHFAEVLGASKGNELALLLAKPTASPGFDFEALVLLYALYPKAEGGTEVLLFENSEDCAEWQRLRDANEEPRYRLVERMRADSPDLSEAELQDAVFRKRREVRLRLRQAESRAKMVLFLDADRIREMTTACAPVDCAGRGKSSNVYIQSRSEIVL